jgi:hypothetical protein
MHGNRMLMPYRPADTLLQLGVAAARFFEGNMLVVKDVCLVNVRT